MALDTEPPQQQLAHGAIHLPGHGLAAVVETHVDTAADGRQRLFGQELDVELEQRLDRGAVLEARVDGDLPAARGAEPPRMSPAALTKASLPPSRK